jgi:pimeloyl-ACP methyl ester carboxylesterase
MAARVHDLAHDDHGTGGTALVLLHGIMSDRSVFSDLTAEITDRRVINVDLRGYGESPAGERYLTSDFVDDVVALLERLGTGPVDLLGWSMGGAVATVLAARRPDLLRNLLLVDTTPCLVQRPDWEPAVPGPAAHALGGLLAVDWAAGAADFAAMVVSEPDREQARARVTRLAELANPEVNLTCFGTVGGEDRRDILGAIAVPVHVICGSADVICPPAASDYLAKATGGSLTFIDGAGHASFLTEQNQFLAALRRATAAP